MGVWVHISMMIPAARLQLLLQFAIIASAAMPCQRQGLLTAIDQNFVGEGDKHSEG